MEEKANEAISALSERVDSETQAFQERVDGLIRQAFESIREGDSEVLRTCSDALSAESERVDALVRESSDRSEEACSKVRQEADRGIQAANERADDLSARIEGLYQPVSLGWQWRGTKLQLRDDRGRFGRAVDLRGENGRDGKNGKNGRDGSDGRAPEHQWQGTNLRFRRPDGSWGKWVDLLGPPGPAGPGGRRGVGVSDAEIVGGDLIITLTNGDEINAGSVSGGGSGSLSRYEIFEDETVDVPAGYNFLLVNDLKLDGELRVDGRVVEVTP